MTARSTKTVETRVSIPALRETCEVIWEADGSEAHGTIARADVLALLEAVEAAHAYVSNLNSADIAVTDALEAALARFDFGSAA